MAVTLALLAPTRAAIAAPPLQTPTSAPAPEASAPAPEASAPVEPADTREVPILRVEASEDEVILLDGSFVRGKIVELAKGSHVTISLGEPRRIPWAEVQEVRVATAPAQPPAPATPPAPAESQPVPESDPIVSAGPGRPRVHIESSNGKSVTLYQIDGGFVGSGSGGSISGIAYRPVCTGTCDEVIDGSRGHKFFVGGDGVKASRPFTLAGDTGRLTLDVKAGNRAAYLSGFLLTMTGGTSLLTGALLIPLSKGMAPRSYERPNALSRGGIAGVGMVVAGSLALVSGIVLLVVGRTVVKKRSRSAG